MSNIGELNLYHLAKHNLYGYRFEVAVLPNELVIIESSHYTGKVQDIDNIMGRIEKHKKMLLKDDLKRDIMDGALYFMDFEGVWALLSEKGYQGILEPLRAILPEKCTFLGS